MTESSMLVYVVCVAALFFAGLLGYRQGYAS